jgi:hypothetical protein
MGNQIIKQPDGHFAVFNTNTDTIIMWDATADEIVDWFVEREAEETRKRVTRLVEKVAAGEARQAYFQFTMTWDEALRQDREHDGEVWTQFPHDEVPD